MNGNWTDLIFLTLPLAYVASAFAAPSQSARTGWKMLQATNALVLFLSAMLPLFPAAASGLFGQSATQMTVLCIVTFIGFIVTRFSTNYLAGDPGEQRFQRWLQITLACVITVVTSNHFAILIAAWAGISLSLHQLLMFYPERKRAVLAAHKKFLFARVAEACLILAAALLYMQHGTLFISDILATYATDDMSLSVAEQIAAVLIASAAMVKCAQFPMHGWLIQVVEAPTPVSALLHAGVINLGGFLVLLMAPLMQHAQVANWLLLIVAGGTCIAAALITMTRVSIKVLLAWSTVAQMGLMLVECALGQYGLALLHLAAHSCYKAHAFLTSGGEVESFLRREMSPLRVPDTGTLPTMFAAILAVTGLLLLNGGISSDASLWLLLALFPLIIVTERSSSIHSGSVAGALVLAAGVVLAYTAQKALFNNLAPAGSLPSALEALWCALLVSVLLGAYWLLRQRGETALGRRLYRNLYAGFYLDEWATRATLAIWPARLPQRAARRRIDTITDQESFS